jgi:hypothetical protein
MQNVQHTQLNTPTKIRDEYTTRDRSINVDTNKETGNITIEVTLFSPVADRVFDRLDDEKRIEWAKEFFDGKNAPSIENYTLIRKGY